MYTVQGLTFRCANMIILHFWGKPLKVKTSLRTIYLKVLALLRKAFWDTLSKGETLSQKDKFEGYCPFFLLPAGLFSSVNLRYDPITFYIWRISSTSKIDDDNTHFCFRKPIFRCVPSLSWDVTPLHLIFEGSVPPPP